MQATRIKMCGITRPEDARFAVESGADAIGLVFYPKSKRYVSPAQAQALLRDIPPFVASVGLFVDAEAKEVEATLAQVPLSLLQFHGDESSSFCASFSLPYMKAFRVGKDADLLEQVKTHAAAEYILLDAFDSKAPGGTGKTFDWNLAKQVNSLPRVRCILAGGLDDSNVSTAISEVDPYGVDVSSGVEKTPGIKDPLLIKKFIEGVRSVSSRD